MNRDGLPPRRKLFLPRDAGRLDRLAPNLEDDEDDGDLHEEEGEKDDEAARLERANDPMAPLLLSRTLNDNTSPKQELGSSSSRAATRVSLVMQLEEQRNSTPVDDNEGRMAVAAIGAAALRTSPGAHPLSPAKSPPPPPCPPSPSNCSFSTQISH